MYSNVRPTARLQVNAIPPFLHLVVIVVIIYLGQCAHSYDIRNGDDVQTGPIPEAEQSLGGLSTHAAAHVRETTAAATKNAFDIYRGTWNRNAIS